MSANLCTRCGRPAPDGDLCHAEALNLAEELRTAAGHADDAGTVIGRQARYGTGTRGGRDQPLPVDLTAAADYAAARNTITTWIRHISENSGPTIPTHQHAAGPVCQHECGHVSCRALQRPTPPIPLADATRWLADQVGWLRTRPEAEQAFDELGYACQVLTRLVDRPEPPQLRLVGMCDCGRILYAPHSRDVVQCRASNCGASWNVTESQDILRAALDNRHVTAAEAAHLAGFLDTDRTGRQIRKLVNKWAERDQITAHEVLVKHHHRDTCEDDCAKLSDTIATYRFGDVADRIANTPRRTASAAEMGA